MTIGTASIQLEHIQRTYRLGKTLVPAVREASVDFHRGEFTALAGPSGSGKTTLLNIIGCIDKPDAGRLIINGEDVTRRPLHRLAGLRNKYFGYVFQTFNLIAVLTAYENVEYPLLLAGVSRAERRERVTQILEAVGLGDHAKHRPSELSGGQRQRVAIARALVTRPLAVLADEPTANLDSRTGNNLIDLMSHLNETENVTFIFSTHDQHIIEKARRVLAVQDGALIEMTNEPLHLIAEGMNR
ncbi:MAG TPA: ABC transporter ATP-binding protein [Thermoanaerobaculia bacterium]|jgi:putative ABC transport system ATP-binding protein